MTAMTLFVILLVLLLLAALVDLVAEVRHDGYGHRPPPPSHHPYFSSPQHPTSVPPR